MTETRLDVLDELTWRGLVALSTDADALRAAFAAGPVTYYCGFDPTAPSLHMGNLVQLLTMRRLQDAGNDPLALVGGATGLIGDPRMSGERVLNDRETVGAWVDLLRAQVERFLDFSGPHPARMVNNLDWTAPLSAIDFLRDVGKHFRVNRMLSKEAVSARLNSESGISFTEFSYQILQGMDFLELYQRYRCTLQTGGSDQWGNLTAGTDLVHRVTGQNVHLMATPLVTKADGSKFGKSEGGAIWLDPAMTSPYAFYQFWLNTGDAEVPGLLRVFTFRTREEIEELERQAAERPSARVGQHALAEDVTTLVHGADTFQRVRAASRALFGQGDLAAVDERTLADAFAEVPHTEVFLKADPGDPDDGGMPTAADLMVLTGIVASKSAARRLIAEGGAYLNNQRVTAEGAVPGHSDLLHDCYLIVRRGKRHVGAVEVRPA